MLARTFNIILVLFPQSAIKILLCRLPLAVSTDLLPVGGAKLLWMLQSVSAGVSCVDYRQQIAVAAFQSLVVQMWNACCRLYHDNNNKNKKYTFTPSIAAAAHTFLRLLHLAFHITKKLLPRSWQFNCAMRCLCRQVKQKACVFVVSLLFFQSSQQSFYLEKSFPIPNSTTSSSYQVINFPFASSVVFTGPFNQALFTKLTHKRSHLTIYQLVWISHIHKFKLPLRPNVIQWEWIAKKCYSPVILPTVSLNLLVLWSQ